VWSVECGVKNHFAFCALIFALTRRCLLAEHGSCRLPTCRHQERDAAKVSREDDGLESQTSDCRSVFKTGLETPCQSSSDQRERKTPDQFSYCFKNVLARDFTAFRPNEKWLTDITYIDTLEGWLYVVVILDLFSRKIV